MSEYATHFLKRENDEFLKSSALAVHPDIHEAANTIDCAAVEWFVKDIVEIGTPADSRQRAAEARHPSQNTAKEETPRWALDGELGGCPYGARFTGWEHDRLPQDEPINYEGHMASDTQRLNTVASALTTLLTGRVTVWSSRRGGTRFQRVVSPSQLQVLLPILYAWIVDLECAFAFRNTWNRLATLFVALCPRAPLYTIATDATSGVRRGELLFTLPWKPLFELLLTTWTACEKALLSVDPSAQQFFDNNMCDAVQRVARRARGFFQPDALEGVWEYVAPRITPCLADAHPNSRLLLLLGDFLPVAHLAATPLAGCHTPDSTDRAGGTTTTTVGPTPMPHPLLADVVKLAVDQAVQMRSAHTSLASSVLSVLTSMLENNVGLVTLDEYAEPLFSQLLACVELPSSQSSVKSGLRTQLKDLKMPVFTIVLGLPADTTTPLWSHLRRFLHAVEPLLRPNTAFQQRAKFAHACLVLLVTAVSLRLSRQQHTHHHLCLARGGTRKGGAVPHAIDSPGYRWTRATVDTFVALLSPVLMPCLTMKLPGTVAVISRLAHLSPALMLPAIRAFVSTAFAGQHSNVAPVVALKLLGRVTATMLESSATQEAFLSLTKSVAEHITESLSPSHLDTTVMSLSWLAVVASSMPLSTLFDGSEAEEAVMVRELVHRVLKMFRGVTNITQQELSCAASLSLVLDGVSDRAFGEGLALIVAECRLESNGLFPIVLARACGTRSPQALLPLLDVAVAALSGTYTESKEPQMTWAKNLAANVMAGCGPHVLPHVPRLEACIEHVLTFITRPFCVDAAAELAHQLVRALTRRRCLGKGSRVFYASRAATNEAEGYLTFAAPADSEYDNDEDADAADADPLEEDPDDAENEEADEVGCESRDEIGAPLWLCGKARMTVCWEDPTEEQASCGAQLLQRWLTGGLDFLRDPVRPYTGSTPARGLDTARGLDITREHGLHAAKVMAGAVNWLAEVRGIGAFVYTAASLATLISEAEAATPVGVVRWHDEKGQPVEVKTREAVGHHECARAPAPEATVRAIARFPPPFTDAALAEVLTNAVLPRFGSAAFEFFRLVPVEAFEGVVSRQKLEALAGRAMAVNGTATEQVWRDAAIAGDEEPAPESLTLSSSSVAAHFMCATEVVALLSDLTGASFRIPNTNSHDLSLRRLRLLGAIAGGAAQRRPANYYATYATVVEDAYYSSQYRFLKQSGATLSCVFQSAQLLVLCPNTRIAHSARAILTQLCSAAVAPVRRLIAGSIAAFLQRVLVIATKRAPAVLEAGMASPLLIEEAGTVPPPAVSAVGATLTPAEDVHKQKLFVARLFPCLVGILSVGLGQALEGGTGGDGRVMASLLSAFTRCASAAAPTAVILMQRMLPHALIAASISPAEEYTSSAEKATTAAHLIRLAWADRVRAPRRAVLLLELVSCFHAPINQMRFWRKNQLAQMAPTRASPALPVSVFTLLVELAGNASPEMSAAAVQLLLPQWLLLYTPSPQTHVVARVTKDNKPCPLAQSADAAAQFWSCMKRLRSHFWRVQSDIGSGEYLPRTVRVSASAEAVRRAWPDVDIVTRQDPHYIHLYDLNDLRGQSASESHEAMSEDAAEVELAEVRAQYRAVMRASVRRGAERGGGINLAINEEDAQRDATDNDLRKSWAWRLVLLHDEKTKADPAATELSQVFLLAAIALGSDAAVPLLRAIGEMALTDTLADTHHGHAQPTSCAAEVTEGQDEAEEATEGRTAVTAVATDGLQPATLFSVAAKTMNAALHATSLDLQACGAPPASTVADETSCSPWSQLTASRKAALELMYDTLVRMSDWRQPHGALKAIDTPHQSVWATLNQDEVRRTLDFLFGRLQHTTSWSEQSSASLVLSLAFTVNSMVDTVLEVFPDICDRICAQAELFLTAGASRDRNEPLEAIRALFHRSNVAGLLEAQLPHLAPASQVAACMSEMASAAFTAIEKTALPPAECIRGHRRDLDVVLSVLASYPPVVPYRLTIAAMRTCVTAALRALDLALPHADPTANEAQLVLQEIAHTGAPKEVTHATLDFLCEVLEHKHTHLCTTPRAMAVVALALESLLLCKLHQIGKYVLIQHVAAAAQGCMAHRDGRVQIRGTSLLSALVRVATNEQVQALTRGYMAQLRDARAAWVKLPNTQSGSPVPALPGDENPVSHDEAGRPTRQQLALVMSLCAVIQAYPSAFPTFVPLVMRQVAALADVPMLQPVVRHTFKAWWDSHRERWETDYRAAFSTEDAHTFGSLWKATYYA